MSRGVSLISVCLIRVCLHCEGVSTCRGVSLVKVYLFKDVSTL